MADRADGSVTYASAFGNLNSNTGFVSGSGFAVNIPRRVDKATVMVIKWKRADSAIVVHPDKTKPGLRSSKPGLLV